VIRILGVGAFNNVSAHAGWIGNLLRDGNPVLPRDVCIRTWFTPLAIFAAPVVVEAVRRFNRTEERQQRKS